MSKELFYNLLPEVHRDRDGQSQNEGDAVYPLRAFLKVVNDQHDALHANVDQLYKNWFIETCEDWVVPYIADLAGAETPQVAPASPYPRAFVGDVIAYRRRKGTANALEHAARAATGWPARLLAPTKLRSFASFGIPAKPSPIFPLMDAS